MARRTLSRVGDDGRRRVLTGGKSFGIDADLSGLLSQIDELGASVNGALRPMAQAAAQVLYDRVKINVATLGKVTGNLDNAIYQYYSQEKSLDGQRAEYHVSWNHKKAPHGQLIEWGWLQRYQAIYNTKTGKWVTLIRPEMVGKPKPGRHASQEQKDAYFVPRAGGPKQHTAKAVVRGAISSMPEAVKAARREFFDNVFAKRRYGP